MFLDSLMGYFSTDGDGSRHRQHAGVGQGRGIVLNEPSVVAVEKSTNRVLAVSEAKLMLGRTPGEINADASRSGTA